MDLKKTLVRKFSKLGKSKPSAAGSPINSSPLSTPSTYPSTFGSVDPPTPTDYFYSVSFESTHDNRKDYESSGIASYSSTPSVGITPNVSPGAPMTPMEPSTEAINALHTAGNRDTLVPGSASVKSSHSHKHTESVASRQSAEAVVEAHADRMAQQILQKVGNEDHEERWAI